MNERSMIAVELHASKRMKTCNAGKTRNALQRFLQNPIRILLRGPIELWLGMKPLGYIFTAPEAFFKVGRCMLLNGI